MVMRKLIHCVEMQDKNFDKKYCTRKGQETLDKDCIGHYYPEDDGTWSVVCCEEGSYWEAKNQKEAQIISNQEQIKAMLLTLHNKQGR